MATIQVKTKNVNAVKYSGGPGASACGTIPPNTKLNIASKSGNYYKIADGVHAHMWVQTKDCVELTSNTTKTSPAKTPSEKPQSTNTTTTVAPASNATPMTQETANNLKLLNDKINAILASRGTNQATLLASNASMRLFGMPHQLLDYNDYRINSITDMGRMFTETFVLDAPIIYIKPGTSNFLPGMSTQEKEAYLNVFASIADGSGQMIQQLGDQIKQLMVGEDLRYFEFKQKYAEYKAKVNLLCRICAVFMDLHNKKVPWHYGNITFGSYDWGNYIFEDKHFTKTMVEPTGNWAKDALKTFINIADTLADDTNAYVKFYVDASTSFSEDASNSTTQSALNSFTDQMSEMGKELSFVSGVSGINIDDTLNAFTGGVDNAMQSIAKGDGAINSFLRRLTGVSSQLLAGSNFLTPEIWNDSSYGKNYSFTINLATPYGNKFARYINLIVPLMHILGVALPTQTSANTYSAPNIVQLFAPGWFSCDMGIIDSVSIDKGGSGDAWASDGMPNELKVTISVKDLYSNLSLPDGYSISKFFNNTGLINFLMVNCGVDITSTGLSDKLSVIINMFSNTISSLVDETIDNIWFSLQDSAKRIFGLYRG